MRTLKEVLRLYGEAGLGVRAVARSCGLSHSTVSEVLARANQAGLRWPLSAGLEEADLLARLYPDKQGRPRLQPEPDLATIHQELRRKGVTLQLLWLEYKAVHPTGYQYSQFCARYRAWRRTLPSSLRQTHRAGEKLFVDYAGQTVPVKDAVTGQVRAAQIFVAVLGASNYTYAEASFTQDLPSWIGAHTRALAFFGGVPALVVPDNLKAGVSRADRYEPDVNPTYYAWAEHYGTAILPTRPYKPRDKAKAENAVLVVERWILAALRHRTFFSLAELNTAMRALLERLNDKPFQKLLGSRRSLFAQLDRPALKPLPAQPYEYAQWCRVRVGVDYHIEVDHSHYSVPAALVRQEVEVRLTAGVVEVLHQGRRVASHARSERPGQCVTDPHHRPLAHQKHLEWTSTRLVAWAEQVGPATKTLVQAILEARPHPEHGYRSCLGLQRLSQHYPLERLEAASARAMAIGARSYRSVKSILEHGLDQFALPSDAVPGEGAHLQSVLAHAHVRGAAYYRLEHRENPEEEEETAHAYAANA
jgi:transposase